MDYTMNLSGLVEGANGEMHPAVLFDIDASRSYGIIHVTDEVSLVYDVVDRTWTGDAVTVDGWVDLEQGEIRALVDELGLQDAADEAAARIESLNWCMDFYDGNGEVITGYFSYGAELPEAEAEADRRAAEDGVDYCRATIRHVETQRIEAYKDSPYREWEHYGDPPTF